MAPPGRCVHVLNQLNVPALAGVKLDVPFQVVTVIRGSSSSRLKYGHGACLIVQGAARRKVERRRLTEFRLQPLYLAMLPEVCKEFAVIPGPAVVVIGEVGGLQLTGDYVTQALVIAVEALSHSERLRELER